MTIPLRLLIARLGLAGWAAGLVMLISVLHRAGSAGLAWPPPAGEQPVTTAFAVLRLGALATAWYLLAATGANVAGHLAGGRRLLAVAELLAVGPVQRLVRGALGAGLVGTLAVSTGGATQASALVPAGMVAAQEAERPVAPPRAPLVPLPEGHGGAEPVVLRRLDPPRAASWALRPGECFWSVAEAVVGTAPAGGGRADVAGYWLRLIEANREALLDPGNPDLVFPGQVLRLPPVGS